MLAAAAADASTLDRELEAYLRGLLARSGVELAHVIAMDPHSGELFAYVSSDPERFPATRLYPTASLMKVVTASALLRRAPEAARRECHTNGSPYALSEAHLARPGAGGGRHARAGERPALWEAEKWAGRLRRALAISHNQCFARYAVHDLGAAALVEEIRAVGLLEPPAPGHPAGALEAIQTALDLGSLGAGLSGSAITPLAAVRLAGLLAEGRLVAPRWADRPEVAEAPAPFPRRVWSLGVTEALRHALRGVTEEGTARRAFTRADGKPRLGPVAVAGKTGTLDGRDPDGLYQWFIGVAPEESPRIAIAVLVVHPEGTPRAASASDVAAAALEHVFCGEPHGCRAAGVEGLYARAARRAAEAGPTRSEAKPSEARPARRPTRESADAQRGEAERSSTR